MKHESNLTSKGQVTIPKDIRDALGLAPGSRVAFTLNDAGNAVIYKVDAEAEAKRRRSEADVRLRDLQQEFRRQDPFAGMDGLAFQRWIRESPEV